MQPPWTAFPNIPAGSIGWRMGDGEDYHNRFYRWYSALSLDAQTQYRLANPALLAWSGIYETIQQNPWV